MVDRLPGRSVAATDFELLHRVRKGDSSAFHELVDRHARALYGVARRMLGNSADAEDVVQETFAGAFRSAATFRGEASVKTWLVRILARQAAHHRRSEKRRMLPLDQAAADSALVMASPAAGVDRRLDVTQVLQMLSPEHRQVLVLREYGQLGYEEIATALGIPRGTVESRLHRARQELKERLKGYLDHEL